MIQQLIDYCKNLLHYVCSGFWISCSFVYRIPLKSSVTRVFVDIDIAQHCVSISINK